MADIAPVLTEDRNGDVKLWTWATLTSTNTAGSPIKFVPWGDRCFQVTGTFGTGTMVLQGSNDGTNWETLTDVLGNALSFTASSLAQVTEVPLYVRPLVTGGSAPTDLDVTIVMRTSTGLRQ